MREQPPWSSNPGRGRTAARRAGAAARVTSARRGGARRASGRRCSAAVFSDARDLRRVQLAFAGFNAAEWARVDRHAGVRLRAGRGHRGRPGGARPAACPPASSPRSPPPWPTATTRVACSPAATWPRPPRWAPRRRRCSAAAPPARGLRARRGGVQRHHDHAGRPRRCWSPRLVRAPEELTSTNVVSGWTEASACWWPRSPPECCWRVSGPGASSRVMAGVALLSAVLTGAPPRRPGGRQRGRRRRGVAGPARGGRYGRRPGPGRAGADRRARWPVRDRGRARRAVRRARRRRARPGRVGGRLPERRLRGRRRARHRRHGGAGGRARVAPALVAAAALVWSLALLGLAACGRACSPRSCCSPWPAARGPCSTWPRARCSSARPPATVLARVFGLLETLDSIGLAIGSLLAPALVVLLGPDHAMAGLAAGTACAAPARGPAPPAGRRQRRRAGGRGGASAVGARSSSRWARGRSRAWPASSRRCRSAPVSAVIEQGRPGTSLLRGRRRHARGDPRRRPCRDRRPGRRRGRDLAAAGGSVHGHGECGRGGAGLRPGEGAVRRGRDLPPGKRGGRRPAGTRASAGERFRRTLYSKRR